MAEDFGPKPYSPRVACRDGVQQSDIYLGIAGGRHGYVGSSGVSVTEEEFDETRSRGLPIIWLIKQGEREQLQQEFIDRLTGYEEGYFVQFFETLDQLAIGITKGLNSLTEQRGTNVLSVDLAAEHIRAIVEASESRRHSDPLLMAVTVPERQGTPYLSSLELDHFRDTLLQPAMFGETALFDRELGVKTMDGIDDIAFDQREDYGDVLRRLQLSTDGTLAWQHRLVTERSAENHLLGYILNQDEVLERLTRFLNYAKWFYGRLEDSPLISSVYVSLAVVGSDRWFGKHPPQRLQSMQMPPGNVDDPLIVPAKPYRASRSELTDTNELANTLVGLMERTYRAAHQTYIPRH